MKVRISKQELMRALTEFSWSYAPTLGVVEGEPVEEKELSFVNPDGFKIADATLKNGRVPTKEGKCCEKCKTCVVETDPEYGGRTYCSKLNSCPCHRSQAEKGCNCDSFTRFERAMWNCDVHGYKERAPKELPEIEELPRFIVVGNYHVTAKEAAFRDKINEILAYLRKQR